MKKMVLIPYEQFIRTNNIDKQNIKDSFKSEGSCVNPNTFNPQLIDSDSEESVSLPNIDNNNSIVTVHPSQDENIHNRSRMTDENVLVAFNKKQQNTAKALLHYAKQHMSWNTNGELIANDNLIRGSHITDLLKDALANYKKYPPVGYIIFYGSLKGVPLSLIHNKDRKHLVGRGYATEVASSRRVPPPGFPINQSPKDITFSDFSFLSKWQSK